MHFVIKFKGIQSLKKIYLMSNCAILDACAVALVGRVVLDGETLLRRVTAS